MKYNTKFDLLNVVSGFDNCGKATGKIADLFIVINLDSGERDIIRD